MSLYAVNKSTGRVVDFNIPPRGTFKHPLIGQILGQKVKTLTAQQLESLLNVYEGVVDPATPPNPTDKVTITPTWQASQNRVFLKKTFKTQEQIVLDDQTAKDPLLRAAETMLRNILVKPRYGLDWPSEVNPLTPRPTMEQMLIKLVQELNAGMSAVNNASDLGEVKKALIDLNEVQNDAIQAALIVAGITKRQDRGIIWDTVNGW
jgi:hypothetical protein